MSGILFASFPTVDYVYTAIAFSFYDVFIVLKKFPVETDYSGKAKALK